MVISIKVVDCLVRKTLVDQWSSTDILFWNTFKQLDITESLLQPHDDPLFGFVSERVSMKGPIELLMRFNTKKDEYIDVIVKYMVIHVSTSYNILLGQLSINAIGAIVFAPHLTMKLPMDDGSIVMVQEE